MIETERIPIVIGVTGHRDIPPEDVPALETTISKFFAELRRLCPRSPFVILSSLAEGADQLVARVGVQDHSAELIIPLPFPRNEYEKYYSRQSLEIFHSLLKIGTPITIPVVERHDPQQISQQEDPRARQYAMTGAYIVRNCHILLALWDGKDSEKTGGTSQVVSFAKEGMPVPYAAPPGLLDEVETTPVYHIPTRRISDAVADTINTTEMQSQEPQLLFKENPFIKNILLNIDLFNSDVNTCYAKNGEQFKQDIKRNTEYVIEDKINELNETEARILKFYAVADTLAIYFRGKNDATIMWLFSLAVLAVLAFEVYAHMVPHWIVLLIYPGTLLLAFGIYYFSSKKGRTQQKYFDYRALAEGLRVALFWRIAGLEEEVRDYYLRKQKNELGWIHRGVQTCSALASLGGERRQSPHEQGLRLTLDRWVQVQLNFFNKRVREDTRKLHHSEKRRDGIFKAGLILAIIVSVADIFFHGEQIYSSTHHLLIVLMGFLPAMAAALGGYTEKMATSAQTKRYEWMTNIYSIAEKRLSACIEKGDYKMAQELILELGQESLEENADWLIMHRERPIEVPKG